jgi:DNA polymerase III gamma/tau subunit
MRIQTLVTFLGNGQTKETLELIHTIVTDGSDIRYMLGQVIASLHAELLIKAGVPVTAVSGMKQTALRLDDLKTLLLLLTQALADMRTAVLPQLPFEIAVIEWGELRMQNNLPADKQAQNETSERNGTMNEESDTKTEKTVVKGADASVSVTTLRKQVGNIKKITALYGETEEKKKKPEAGPPANVSVLNFSAKGDITPEWLEEFWTCIIANIKQHNHTLAGVLRGCMIKSFDRKQLVIETAYTFHREKLDNGQTKEVLEKICRDLTGNPVSVTVELKS